jgi:hydrogenase maturation factor
MILKQLKNGEEKIENQYKRLVLDDGNWRVQYSFNCRDNSNVVAK